MYRRASRPAGTSSFALPVTFLCAHAELKVINLRNFISLFGSLSNCDFQIYCFRVRFRVQNALFRHRFVKTKVELSLCSTESGCSPCRRVYMTVCQKASTKLNDCTNHSNPLFSSPTPSSGTVYSDTEERVLRQLHHLHQFVKPSDKD